MTGVHKSQSRNFSAHKLAKLSSQITWRIGGVWQGRQSAPLFSGKCLLTMWEKRGKENRENGEEMKENCKREAEKYKMEGSKNHENEDPFVTF